LGVFSHGTVETLNLEDGEPVVDWPNLLAYLEDFYGDNAFDWDNFDWDNFDWDNEVAYCRLRPRWMTVYAPMSRSSPPSDRRLMTGTAPHHERSQHSLITAMWMVAS
jgi:hypothetical protein